MFEPLANSASTDELPSSADVDKRSDDCLTCHGKPTVQKRKLPTAVHDCLC